MAKQTVRNTSGGYRGLNTVGGGYVELSPGQTVEGVDLSDAELASAKDAGYFEFGGKATAPADDDGGKSLDKMNKAELEAVAAAEGVDLSAATNQAGRVEAIEAARKAAAGGITPGAAAPADDLDNMSDADLRTTVAAVTGKPETDYTDTSREDLLALARAPA